MNASIDESLDENPEAEEWIAAHESDAAGAEIEALRGQVAAQKEQALRYAAEAENTRRRAEREVNDAKAFAITRFAKDLMGVADNLARALEHAPKDADDQATRNLVVGLEMTQKALLDAFGRNNLRRIAPVAGDRFDPHQHQAMMEQSSDTLAPGAVVQALQDGYELFGRNLRPAMVVVAAKDSKGVAESEAAPAAPGVID